MSRRITIATTPLTLDNQRPAAAPRQTTRAPRRRTERPDRATTADPTPQQGHSSRLRTLVELQPRLDPIITETLRNAVVTTLTPTPYVNDQVDRTRASILYRYAAHMLSVHGRFDPVAHLAEEHLVDYWVHACAGLTPRSRDKALSALRTIAMRQPFSDGLLMRRPPTSAPYSDLQWSAFHAAARRLTDEYWSTEAHMLLDLSGEVGLRGAEINQARGSHLSRTGSTLTVTVRTHAQPHGRLVPVSGDTAARLQSHVGSTEYLLRPAYRNRKNAVSSLVTRLATRDSTFAEFRTAAARHRWIARLLTLPIAHVDVVCLADLDGDNHTLHDIRAHVPAAIPARAVDALLRASTPCDIAQAATDGPGRL